MRIYGKDKLINGHIDPVDVLRDSSVKQVHQGELDKLFRAHIEKRAELDNPKYDWINVMGSIYCASEIFWALHVQTIGDDVDRSRWDQYRHDFLLGDECPEVLVTDSDPDCSHFYWACDWDQALEEDQKQCKEDLEYREQVYQDSKGQY